MSRWIIACAVLTLCLSSFAAAQGKKSDSEMTPKEVIGNIVQATIELQKELSDAQIEALCFDFDDNDQRERWSNLPVTIVERAGLRMGDLSESQKAAVFKVLRATLSEEGVEQVLENVAADEVLRNNSRRGMLMFGEDEFYFSILGKPTNTEPWMWQFGGHHLAINATIRGEQITLSPSLTGGQPMRYERSGKMVSQLDREIPAAYALIQSLNSGQQKKAVVSSRTSNLRYGPGETDITPRREGIRYSDLSSQQQGLMKKLISKRIEILNPIHAAIAMKKIEASLSETFFAWYGLVEEGRAASFRIQGPNVIVEYCPQRMGGDATQHIHAMYRDPSNDYGNAIAK